MAELAYPPQIRIQSFRIVTAPWTVARALRITGFADEFVIRSGCDLSDGYDSGPSLRLGTLGHFRLRLPVESGQLSVSVYAKQPVADQPRPRLVVRSNPEIGLAEDMAQTALGGNGWLKIGPITFVASQRGGVWLELWNPSNGWPCWFDKIEVI